MTPILVAFAVTSTLAPAVDLPTLCWGIEPAVLVVEGDTKLKPRHDRAVLLVHGLLPRVWHPDRAEKPEAHEWQVKEARLVKAISDDADVYGFSYAQTRTVDEVALSRGLREGMGAIKAAGYKEIVLVGHSAGGLVCRRFVELFPDAGVTKVVAVAAPFGGSGWAKMPGFTLPKTQVPFIHSLSPEARETTARWREAKVPSEVEFACVLCRAGRGDGDYVVGLRSQWPDDLQKVGVPVVLANCTHLEAMTCEPVAREVTRLVSGKVVRWDEDDVAKARRVLFGERR
ncbi:MAG: alpha/beta fold hydrolase [Fimbriiglobus sp.]|jgi:pimeloyl-ACP methyl ester carboxylesterase|nr:alpha/beta fold hydrolase [Fimbriiglobus sp.]